MSSWQDKAIKALEDSLHPVPQELNTIDWKCALSDKSERLAQHICAFSNTANGGFLAFGVNDDTTFASLSKEEIEEITNKLGNVAKNNLAWSVQLEHAVVDYQGHAILFIRIAEQTNKPIYLRGKDIYEAYIRSAGHTVKMSKEQVHELIAHDSAKQKQVFLCIHCLKIWKFQKKLLSLQRQNLCFDYPVSFRVGARLDRHYSI